MVGEDWRLSKHLSLWKIADQKMVQALNYVFSKICCKMSLCGVLYSGNLYNILYTDYTLKHDDECRYDIIASRHCWYFKYQSYHITRQCADGADDRHLHAAAEGFANRHTRLIDTDAEQGQSRDNDRDPDA